MNNLSRNILSVAIVLLVAVVINGFGTLALTDLGTYDNSPKKQKEVINANNTLAETAVNANLATGASNLALFTAQSGATVTTTAFTPRYLGDVLVDTADSDVWISKGITTNDWVKVD